MTRTLRAALAAAGLLCAAAAPASAAMVISGAQSGTDFVFTYSGSITVASGVNFSHETTAGYAFIEAVAGAFGALDGYGVYSMLYSAEPTRMVFGTGSFIDGGSASGDSFGFYGTDSLYLPLGYVSGDPINGTLTFANADMASLGLTAGSHSLGIPSGDTITLNIGAIDSGPEADVPLPAAAPLLLAGLGLAGMVSRRRKG